MAIRQTADLGRGHLDFSHRLKRVGGVTGASLAAVVSPKPRMSPASPSGEYDTLRQRWVDLITGRKLVIPSLPVFQAALAVLDRECDRIIATIEPALTRNRVFVDCSLADEAAMTESFVRIQTLSKAWATPGSRFYQSTYLRGAILDAVRTLHRRVYYPGTQKSGNWWSWEIGSALALADTLAIFRDHLDQLDLRAYCDAIDYVVPDPWSQQGGITSTGANRADLCRVVVVRSLLTGDDERLTHAVQGLSDTWQYVTSGDGFYADGSFIQHNTVAYTGTYGVVLLDSLSLLFALLAGSLHDINDSTRSNVYRAVDDTYAPLIYRGRMMDAVRGRAISREDQRSVDYGDDAIEAILRLSLAVDTATATRWRGLCRDWVEHAREGEGGHDILAEASIARAAMIHELMTSGTVALPEASTGRLFPAMDRLVHRGSNATWAMTIAMSSRRVTWYECGNGENDRGAQTGSGMTYLYIGDASGYYDDEFWPTSDLAAPPGTTVGSLPLPPRVEGQWGARCPQNEWTGGSVLDEWSLAGLHLRGPGDTGVSARKTWFAGPDFVVCLGSDITTAPMPSAEEDDDASVSAKTVVEHRHSGLKPATLVVDGAQITGNAVLESPRWAHIPGTAGYVFLADATVAASVNERSGSWRSVNESGSETVHTRHYATIEIAHSRSTAGEYAYLVLPTATESATRSAAFQPPVSLVANTADVQAVATGDVTAVNFWRAASAAGVTADRPASVIVRYEADKVSVAASDPTQLATELMLELLDVPGDRVEGERVTMSKNGSVTRLAVDVRDQGGLPVTFQLLRRG